MPEALAMVKVGNSECGFLKLTPLSRTSAMAGAVSGVTCRARKPSGMNRIRLCGVLFCADAPPAASVNRPADSSTIAQRMNISLQAAILRPSWPCLCLVLLCDGFVTVRSDAQRAIPDFLGLRKYLDGTGTNRPPSSIRSLPAWLPDRIAQFGVPGSPGTS